MDNFDNSEEMAVELLTTAWNAATRQCVGTGLEATRATMHEAGFGALPDVTVEAIESGREIVLDVTTTG